MTQSVGVIGPGAMGFGITQALLRAGFVVFVRDINPERNQVAASAGATVCASAAEVAARADIVVTVVVNAQQTREVCFGTSVDASTGLVAGMARNANPRGCVLMCSTIAPEDTIAIAAQLAESGIMMIDAPISGGPVRAAAGTMSMMLAGPAEALARCESVLAAMSDKRFVVSHTAGDGSKMKLVNNLMAGINSVAAAEAFSLGIKAGLDPHKIYQVVMASSGQSWMAGDRMQRILAGDRTVTAAVPIITKDVGLALDLAKSLHAPVPLGSQAHQVFQATLALGHAAEDDNAVIRFYQAITGIPLPDAPGETPR